MVAKVMLTGLILGLAACQPGDTTVLTPPVFPSVDEDTFEMPIIRFAGSVVWAEGGAVAGAQGTRAQVASTAAKRATALAAVREDAVWRVRGGDGICNRRS